jgi:DNA (cytosine-5)-methyltransferase 1
LYLTVPAFAVASQAKMCIVENVPAVLNDHANVVETALELFESEGYHVTAGVLSAAELGWPQTRKRHFLVARKDVAPIPLAEVAAILRDKPRPLWWAIGDLEDDTGDDVLGQVTELSAENRIRVDWLFENDEYDLDLKERPKSHRAGTTYTAVYGRLRKDRPAPTITTGFMSPGRGRFTHPTRRRALTAREAARLQGFPDSYVFVPEPARPPSRKLLSKWIGDAVPMPLGYAAALSALAPSAWRELT